MDGKRSTRPQGAGTAVPSGLHPNRVYTRNQLLDEVWGFDYFGDSRTVDVHIKRLREKVEGVSDQWALKTVWGVGYKFETVGARRQTRRSNMKGLVPRAVSRALLAADVRHRGHGVPDAGAVGRLLFLLSYSYARGQKTDELMVRAHGGEQLSVRYLETGRYLSMEELQKDEQFRQLATTAAVISEMDILVCDGRTCSPVHGCHHGGDRHHSASVMDKVPCRRHPRRSRLDQIYASKQFMGGVSVVNPDHRGGPGGGVHRLHL